MTEALYTFSPITVFLSFLAICLALVYPLFLGKHSKIRNLIKPLFQLIVIIVWWNLANIIGTLFFSNFTNPFGAQIVFGIQAIAWVQAGNAIYHLITLALNVPRSNFWKVSNILGALSVITATVLLCLYYSEITQISIFDYTLFKNYPTIIIFTIIFFTFVFPELLLTLYALLQSSLKINEKDDAQIIMNMFGGFCFFIFIPFFIDFILPFIYLYKIPGHQIRFLEWNQLSCIFLTVLCGQYFTSISFKNRSFHRLFEKLTFELGDAVISFNENGYIQNTNPAAQTLFKTNEINFRRKKITEILPDLDYSNETKKDNVNIKIGDEVLLFNLALFKVLYSLTTSVNIVILNDQSHSILYKQRIESLDKQFSDYKQDLINYQSRLNSSQKKFNENYRILETLINALPFQLWSKNEHGVITLQNKRDIDKRGNLSQTTTNIQDISDYEIEVRDNGETHSFISYENIDCKEISEDDANVQISKELPISIYENHFTPIPSSKPPYKIIGIKIDITEQKKLEQERNTLREQKIIHSRLEELGTICGAFAHDYNNILGSQIGFCELAQETLFDLENSKLSEDDLEKIKASNQYVAEAAKAANRAKSSLQELLNSIRGQTQNKSDNKVFAPYMIIEDVKSKISLTLPPNIKINTLVLDKSLRIFGLPASLDRIISNLANNAIFAMKENGGVLSFGLEKSILESDLITIHSPPVPAGEYAMFTISDTGTGMDSNTLERIFSPFFTTKAPGEGLGLGLSSTLRLLKEGNAHFTIHTTLGKGTIFNLYWKLRNDNTGKI